MTKLAINQDYKDFLIDLKTRIRSAQIKAAHVVNRELIQLYWEMGKSIIERQKLTQWGSSFLEQLSKDLKNEFPGMAGFSTTNLKVMRKFAEEYQGPLIGQQAVDQLPWGHIQILLFQIKDLKIREWYASKTLKNGWSRSVLEMQIETDLYSRQGKPAIKVTNFHERLPKPQSDLAEQEIKDPYIFDFLTIAEGAHERATEKELTRHITKFLLELGSGFSFVGNQVPIKVGDSDFFIDMLFYHLKLRSYVVIELKARKFKPEDAGQLNFYLSAVDAQLKTGQDNPTIGILLCKSKDKIVAEYALNNVTSPIGVSDYQLTKMMPKNLKTSLPTIEEIEAELSDEKNTK